MGAPRARKPERRVAGVKEAKRDTSVAERAGSKATAGATTGAEQAGGGDPRALTVRRCVLALSLAVGTLAVYCRTLYPSVAGGDATEFAFAACQFSVPHPPGYPTYLLLSHLFVRFLPWGSPAARANASAALCGSGATAVLFLAVEASTGSEVAGVFSAGLFAFGRLIWSYAIQSEVFALNNFFAATLFYLAVRYDGYPSDRTAYLGAFFCGLALTNQHTIFFYVVPITLFVLAKGGARLLTPLKILKLTVLVFAGMLPYAINAWRSTARLPGSWGDLTNVSGFLTHLLRSEYGTFRLFAGAERGERHFMYGLQRYFENFLEDSRYVGAGLALLGAVLVTARGGQVQTSVRGANQHSGKTLPGMRLLVFCWLFYTLVFHYIGNLPIQHGLYLGVHARFWMQSHVAAHQLIGVGAAGVARLMDAALTGRPCDRLQMTPSAAATVLFIGSHIGLNFIDMDESNNTLVLQYGRELLRPLPHKARLVVKGDMITNTARYLQVCEGYRTDVQMIDMSMMTYPWFQRMQAANLPDVIWPNKFYHPFQPEGFSMATFLAANTRPPHGEMFMAGGWHPEDPTPHEEFDHLPWGLADLVVRRNVAWDFRRWIADSEGALPRLELPRAGNYSEDRWERIVVKDYYQAVHKRAHTMLKWFEQHEAEVEVLQASERIMATTAAESPYPEAYMFRNLGVARQQLLSTPLASNAVYVGMVEAFRRYLGLADPREPGYDLVQQVVDLHDEKRAAGGAT